MAIRRRIRKRWPQRYQSIVQKSLERWAAGKATDDDAHWISWMLEKHLLTNSANLTPKLHELTEEYRFTDMRIAAPKVFHGVADLDPGYNFPVLPAGDATHPGKIVPRGFLRLLTGGQDGFQVFGSGTARGRGPDRQPAKSTDRARDGEPDLACTFSAAA